MYQESEPEPEVPDFSYAEKVAVIRQEETVIKEQLAKELELGTRYFFWLAGDLVNLYTPNNIWIIILEGFPVLTYSTDQQDLLRDFIKNSPPDGAYT